jgi:hypothetical protein
MLGRPPNNPPKLAFAVRRYMTLVQVLATDQRISTLVYLCEAWGVEPALYHGAMDRLETIQRLSQHVVEYHRSVAAD